ncbi:MAG: protein-disulfide reductase DsbD N-terminal domain-containing protein, partial [Acidobacteriaceae bacterium]|nr:protein-disulfide reductase DsbD N-terminal domain-containing protein [Acidobacteriaceae bacterium]
MRRLLFALSISALLGPVLFWPARLLAKEDPVQWSLAPAAGGHSLELKADIQPGWHLYSPTTPPGGPIITRIRISENPAIAEYQVYRPQPVRKLDPNFQIDTETYAGAVTFLIAVTPAASASGKMALEATIRYQACTDVKCLPPVTKKASAAFSFAADASSYRFRAPAGYALVAAEAAKDAPPVQASSAAAPVRSFTAGDEPLLPFLITAF